MTTAPHSRYNAFHQAIFKQFGERIFRVTVNAGMTCPNVDGTKAKGGCTFCSEVSYTGNTFQNQGSVTKQISDGMEYIKKRHHTARLFAYFQNGTNTYAPVEVLRTLYKEALNFPEIAGLFIATRPDCLGEDVLDLLSELNEKTHLYLEMGLQSHKDEILKRLNRAHTADDYVKAIQALHKRKIKTCTHLIVGLPGESEQDNIDKAHFMNQLPLDAVKIHNLVVFKDTVLEKQAASGYYKPMSLTDYTKLCVDFLENLRPDILIQRLNAHGPRHETVAPEWSVNKWEAINAIHNELEKRDTWQGKLLGKELNEIIVAGSSVFKT